MSVSSNSFLKLGGVCSRRTLKLPLATAFLLMTSAVPLSAQTSPPNAPQQQGEVEQLRGEVQQLRDEIERLRLLVEKKGATETNADNKTEANAQPQPSPKT